MFYQIFEVHEPHGQSVIVGHW